MMQKETVGIHDGGFHADEVTACALLFLFKLIKKEQIIRTRDPNLLACCEYVCDVGGVYSPQEKKFDHHQASYLGPLSSAGMVLKYLLEIKKIDLAEYDLFNNALIFGVDAHDNGKDLVTPGVSTYSHIIAHFLPIQYESSDELLQQGFEKAFDFAFHYLEKLLERFHYIRSFKAIVQEKMASLDQVLIFEQNIPWMDSFFALGGKKHPALFVIMPSGNHWKLRAIPPTPEEKMDVRKPLPLKWAGLLEKDLQKITGIEGAIFCHKGRFFSLWNSKQDALIALKLALEN